MGRHLLTLVCIVGLAMLFGCDSGGEAADGGSTGGNTTSGSGTTTSGGSTTGGSGSTTSGGSTTGGSGSTTSGGSTTGGSSGTTSGGTTGGDAGCPTMVCSVGECCVPGEHCNGNICQCGTTTQGPCDPGQICLDDGANLECAAPCVVSSTCPAYTPCCVAPANGGSRGCVNCIDGGCSCS